MNPIEIEIRGHTQQSSQEICMALLDTARWPEFAGYSILPGIKRACFEARTPHIVGSRIKVQNTDGSSHVEEIVEWDAVNRVALKFQEFQPPLKHLATHFLETWRFEKSSTGTQITRTMAMYPKGWLGWLLLFPISRLMKKAFEKDSSHLGDPS